MYELFIKNNETVKVEDTGDVNLIANSNIDLINFFLECGGSSFNNGLYKTHIPSSSLHWAIIISNLFPTYRAKITPFGYDWLGRQYAVDRERTDYLLMFDPATAEYFELKGNIHTFHVEELVRDRENILSDIFFDSVLKKLELSRLPFKNCLSYKIPLFMGGKIELNNFEMSDVEVYWEIQSQIYLQIKDLPIGTKINSIKFNARE